MQSSTPANGLEYIGLQQVEPATVGVDDVRPNGARDPGDRLTKSVHEVGIVQPPLVCERDGDLVALDGTRRLRAAEKTGADTVPILLVDGDDAAALSAWLALHTYGKSVTDADHDAAVRRLVGVSPRDLLRREDRAAVEQAKFELGLRTTTDRILDATSRVDGVGPTIATALANEFGSVESVREATVEDLENVPGVGQKRAKRLRHVFDKQAQEGLEANV